MGVPVWRVSNKEGKDSKDVKAAKLQRSVTTARLKAERRSNPFRQSFMSFIGRASGVTRIPSAEKDKAKEPPSISLSPPDQNVVRTVKISKVGFDDEPKAIAIE